MCLATPVKVLRLLEHKALVKDFNFEKTIDISLLPDVKEGDWLLCHDQMAINIIEEKEALEILELAKTCHHNH